MMPEKMFDTSGKCQEESDAFPTFRSVQAVPVQLSQSEGFQSSGESTFVQQKLVFPLSGLERKHLCCYKNILGL